MPEGAAPREMGEALWSDREVSERWIRTCRSPRLFLRRHSIEPMRAFGESAAVIP